TRFTPTLVVPMESSDQDKVLHKVCCHCMRSHFLQVLAHLTEDAQSIICSLKMFKLIANVEAHGQDLPNYWHIVIEHAICKQATCTISEGDARILIENLRKLNDEAFDSDKVLLQNMINLQSPRKAIRVPFLSPPCPEKQGH
uniref:Uncharacterized protein n=1 Tax=Amphimedon queenslandica TaxID=400682 RepID=A0A1X7U3F1_AMPQE